MFCSVTVIIITSIIIGEMIPSETSPHNISIQPEGGIKNISEMNPTYSRFTAKYKKLDNKIKSSHTFLQNLTSFQTFLKMVIYMYADTIEKHENLYSPVKTCGFDKCGHLTSAPTSEKIIVNILETKRKFKNKHGYLKYIKKQIPKSLTNFQRDVEIYEQMLQYLIGFKQLSHFKDEDTTNGNRTSFLKTLRRELKILRIYLSTNDTAIDDREKLVNLVEPYSQTSLMIKEWQVFSYSKKYLDDYKKNITTVIQKYKVEKEKTKKLTKVEKEKTKKLTKVKKEKTKKLTKVKKEKTKKDIFSRPISYKC